jgi:hypothetical protein
MTTLMESLRVVPPGEWPTLTQYTLMHQCPRCKAYPWEWCLMWGYPSIRGFHVARSNLGLKHHDQDVSAAHWSQYRQEES